MRTHSNPFFIIDKRGQTVFFPWRIRGKGYIVPDPKTRRKLNILSSSFTWLFILLVIVVVFFTSFLLSTWGGNLLCMEIFIGVPINWLILYSLFVEAITKNLSVYPLGYKELILDNISSSVDDVSND